MSANVISLMNTVKHIYKCETCGSRSFKIVAYNAGDIIVECSNCEEVMNDLEVLTNGD